ncbi:hypothetical protein P691DRAFT_803656 [Macrolepiota fuliginosa MF-IS2]|uniref:Telomerase reverse transcriptase n=1 Tax=Macrolepiota fuliginosa MF-IS2 TaxID=1400762 RepID=A0A9P5XAV3_9AGAR|nr:hypothetical protein P691DRAFT_803656 [Macrolepiota fuliginosa MF-IS2]
MKMHCYLREWGIECRKHVGFIRGTIQKMINHSFSSLCAQSQRKLSKSHSGSMKKEAVLWLGYHAFREILSRKPSRYKALIMWLKSEMHSSRYRMCEKKLRTVVRDGLLGMEDIAY